jgi:hypothetical protein
MCGGEFCEFSVLISDFGEADQWDYTASVLTEPVKDFIFQ